MRPRAPLALMFMTSQSPPPETAPFSNRSAAGARLGELVRELELPQPLLVLALPRGGVPVAVGVAAALDAPLDVLVVRKIGMPGEPELAVGAIAPGGTVVRESRGAGRFAPDRATFAALERRERMELERRERTYRAGLPPLDLKDHAVVLVDDGLATGATMLAAVRAARAGGATSVTVAAPVASQEAAARVRAEADHLAILRMPPMLFAIAEWYADFHQLTDMEVMQLLHAARSPRT
ncbi:MAG TPA: phosphoribosyltransferase family protein [Steroidobacteraceae bacterium]|nr:phosphoribosyltransferase family protein [Steroidobacteraceae bacterium]